MKTLSILTVAAVAGLSLAHAQQALTISPKHRYRFDNASGSLTAGTQLTDTTGTAHGFIRGSGASANGTGVRITGGSSASAAYIDLPNASMSGSAEIYPGFAEASYEVWITVHSNQNWSRILDFGNNSIDEVTAPGGTFNGADYVFVSANIGTANNIRFERGGQYLTGGGSQDIAGATTVGTRMHLVATYDTTSAAWKLYKNGALIATVPTLLGPSTLDDLNVWLGRSNWGGDNNADATYDEFRMYDYALSVQQVLGNYQAGPEVVTSEVPANQAPVFTSNPLSKPNAIIHVAYSNSLAGSATDPNAGDALSFSKTGGPAWLSVAANGTLGGTPPAGSGGANAFTVRVTDPGGLFSQATLNITVDNNQPPVFVANPLIKDSASTGVAYSATLSGDASDPENAGAVTFSKVSGPAWLAVATNGTLGGTPPSGSSGLNSFTVRATDTVGMWADATLNITVTESLPAGWAASDIGSPALAGSASHNSGTYTVNGSGADIGGTADSFHFASQTLTGDGEIRVRVTSQSNTDPAAKAGLMIRDGSGADAVNALVAVTPSNGFTFQRRTTVSGTTTTTAGPALNAVPNNWLRLTRSGTLVTAYVSANGTSWIQVGTATLSMANSVSAGLAVTSRNAAALGTAAFDNFAITPYPAPWLTADIGTTGLQGSAEYSGGAHTLKGAGAFGGSSDGFRYVYQSLASDGSIIARVNTLQNTGTNARVGVMMRDTLAANARMAALTVDGSGAWRWQRRTLAGGLVSTTNSSSGTAPNLWVRLARIGSTVTASRSTNGTSWTTIGSVTVTMGSSYYVGLAVASGSTSTMNTSVIDNVTVGTSPPPFVANQDLDGDGLNDSWESMYYDPEQHGASDDADADGISNRDEFVAGTIPADPSDFTKLRLKTVSPAVLEFEGRSDRSYTIERMLPNGSGQWETVEAIHLLGDETVEVIDESAPADRSIYRLKIEFSSTP